MADEHLELRSVRINLVLKWTLVGLSLLYLINCLTPLRLHVDSIRYFAIKDCIELGCPPEANGARDYLPYGYTALLLALSKVGLLGSFALVFINCLYLFGALVFLVKIMGKNVHPRLLAVLILLSWTSIKFALHPLSEMQYLFFSIGSLYFHNRFIQGGRWVSLLGSFSLAAIAFITKTVGIALLAALITALMWHYRNELMTIVKRNRIAISSFVLIGLVAVAFSSQLGLHHYLGVFATEFDKGATVGDILRWHFMEWGELLLNAPLSKVGSYFPREHVSLFYLVVGVVAFIGTWVVAYLKRSQIPASVILYLLFYSVIIFSWPFYDPRFWVPVLPLILGILLQIPLTGLRVKIPPAVPRLAISAYAILGIFSLAYYTYTSLNEKALSATQANGVYKSEYETLFFGEPLDPAKIPDPEVVHLLKRYGR